MSLLWMGINRDYRDGSHAPGEKPWHERVLVVWIEDDATEHCEGYEGPNAAFERLTGYQLFKNPYKQAIDLGDCTLYLHSYGWTICYTPDGAQIGVVYREK